MNFGASERPSSTELAAIASVFVVLTCALTYPQIFHLSTHVGPHYDALFSIWRLAWVAHQLRHDPLRLFDANIFYPQTNTLAYSDATLLLGLIAAPAIWIGAQPALVYNLLVLASFVTCGVAMYFFVRAAGGQKAPAVLAATVFAFQPYRFAHHSQIELLWTCWIPLALWSLHRAMATYRARDGVLLGLFVALQAWSCLYYGVFLATALAVIALVLAAGIHRRELVALWKPAIAASVTSCVLLMPYAVPYLSSGRVVGSRTVQDVQNWSPRLVSYTTAQVGHWLYRSPSPDIDPFEGVLFPGAVAISLALVGVLSRPKRYAIAYAVLGLFAFDLSLGFNGWLYRFFFDTVWPYQGLRVPARLFVIVSVSLAVLAALGMTRVLAITRFGRVSAMLLLFAALIESISIPIPLASLPTPPKLYAWLVRQPHGVVLEWPIPRPEALGFTQEPQYMYFSILHWRRMVNGYSGYAPRTYLDLLERVRDFPSSEAIRYLQNRGVRYVILHREPDPERYLEVAQQLAEHPILRLQFVEKVGIDEIAAVYLLESTR